MKNTILFVLAAISFGAASCVRDRGPQPHYPRQYSFVEDFNDDRNRWSFSDLANYASGSVAGGTFLFEYQDDLSTAYYISRDIQGFNRFDDFTIHTRIGSDNNMGLLFGYNSARESYGYSFTVDYDGYFALYDEGGNGYGQDIVALIAPRRHSAVNPGGEWNDLRLEQRGRRWLGFINDVQVFNIDAQQMTASSAGFVLVPFTQGEADYLQVDWLQ